MASSGSCEPKKSRNSCLAWLWVRLVLSATRRSYGFTCEFSAGGPHTLPTTLLRHEEIYYTVPLLPLVEL